MPDFLDRLGEELMRVAGPAGATVRPDFLARLGAELAGAAERAPSRRPVRQRRRPIPRRAALALVAAVLLAAAAGAVATNPPWETGPVPPGAGEPAISRIDPAAIARFAILRRAPRAGDGIPAGLHVAFSGASGADLSLARRAEGVPIGRAWVIPGRGSLCLLVEVPVRGLGGAACTTEARAARGELVEVSATESARPGFLVAGLLPDGASDARFSLADGTTLATQVHEGVYVALLPRPASSVRFRTPAGPVSVGGLDTVSPGH